MFLGVPVLARAIEGNKALIEDGKNGLLYHSPEVDILAIRHLSLY